MNIKIEKIIIIFYNKEQVNLLIAVFKMIEISFEML